MRNAIELGDGLIITTDNSGGIGEKPNDLVAVPDKVTAHFAARVALLEQWAAHADPIAVLIHNFSGDESWEAYVAGVEEVFRESNLDTPKISGSTETNMQLMQSAVAVTMIGRKREAACETDCAWYVYGTPLVGGAVMDRSGEIASLRLIKEAMDQGIIHRIWPVGSRGILEEFQKLTGNLKIEIQVNVDVNKSAGPATSVLVSVPAAKIEKAKQHFQEKLYEIVPQSGGSNVR
ncbi:hypothetical protein QTL97_05685 [Sporosarcina thermotolerans]|uniref:Alpha-ribazole-5-phosphate synthase n=1 Tax=Sporosarcina thermotolerans TaxID=633404 RepID=A0AAW9A5F6_9BACL|nr:hypothetical protein [Sporosarcina thermotolerans]MDW0116417.1 hypothetical protein [Sporosarcina thermotolerans]WHT48367.1 hypothetical protein QNH10_00400 [Sporosarcina thermotolerans]